MRTTTEATDLEIGDDLEVTKVTRHAAGAGTWVLGRLNGYRFNALVFPQHAEEADWEFEDSRISKLWVQRQADRRTVFNWDRGADVPSADRTTSRVVDFLATGIAEYVFLV